MRGFHLALGLIAALWAGAAQAVEIEERRLFPGAGPGLLRIVSTTDSEAFVPLIEAFQAARPDLSVEYVVASSSAVHAAVGAGEAFDLAISSAMDLQMKLANDGHARTHRSDIAARLPGWARWRDQLFAFAQEPVVMIVNRAAFEGLAVPRTRGALIEVLRDNPDRFMARVGTYDPALSGAGYLFATQDTRQSDASWRLAEVLGRLEPRLYTTSGDMISDVQSGDLALALNVVGSYAVARLADGGAGIVVEPEDYTHVLLRTALIPDSAQAPELGAAFLDFLLSPAGQRLIDEEGGLPRIDEAALAAGPHRRPIRLDPGLLVFIDPLMRQRFLSEWNAAVIQP